MASRVCMSTDMDVLISELLTVARYAFSSSSSPISHSCLAPSHPTAKFCYFSSQAAFADQAICVPRVSVSKWKRRPDFSSVSVSDRSATAHDA